MANSKEIKWTTYEHNGVQLSPDYVSRGYKIEGAKDPLVIENMLWDLSMYVGDKKIQDKRLIKNFNTDLKNYGSSLTIADYMPVLEAMKAEREYIKAKRASRSKEEIAADKAVADKEKEARKNTYGYATIDGVKMELTACITEGSRVFVGRGSHPKYGCWLPKVQPEDIVINTSNLKNPPKPPKGHHWKEVVCRPTTFMAWWYDLEKVNEKKFATVGQGSVQGMENNRNKFDTVKKLAENWDRVGKAIDTTLKESKDETEIQIGMVAYLIRNLGIRMGNDQRSKSGEYATNVVGASTLRKNNIIWNEDGTTRFHFLGKDSIEYDNTFNLEPYFKSLLLQRWKKAEGDGKKKWDDLKGDGEVFPKAKSNLINEYFDKILPGLTAKEFRTAYGSALLSEEFRKLEIKENESVSSIKIKMEKAQLAVAEKLNHKRTVSEKQKESYKNQLEKLDEKQKENKEKLEEITKKWHEETDKEKKAKLNAKRLKLQEKIETNNNKKDLKKGTSSSATSTSKSNYSDPRVITSFCNQYGIDIEKAYTAALRKKFDWAIAEAKETKDTEFYKTYPSVTEN